MSKLFLTLQPFLDLMTSNSSSENDSNDHRSEGNKALRVPRVRWVPLRGVPLERRLQTAAVSLWVFLLFICLSVFAYCFLHPFLWPLLIAYIIFLHTDKAPETGGRRFDWARRWRIWNYFVDYFPVKLIKVVPFLWYRVYMSLFLITEILSLGTRFGPGP